MNSPIDINDLCHRAYQTALSKGFWHMAYALSTEDERTKLLAKMALVTSEIGEAVEALRTERYGNIEEELADICIRVFDIAGYLRLSLHQAILAKMDSNEGRPPMHGKLA